jgi:hypothetical protein
VTITPVPNWVNLFPTAGADVIPQTLGTGTHEVYLFDRGGTRRIAKITPTTLVRWNRIRDDISEATVIVTKPDAQCCDVLASMAVGRHELVIFRNGERVWEGPLTRVAYKADSVEMVAHDVCHYLSRTIMRAAYDNRYSKTKSKVGPVTRRAQIILSNELKRKEGLIPPINVLRFLEVRTHPKTTKTSRFTHAYASSVWEELDHMAAKLSLDYTTIGRRIIINDVHDIIGRTEMLTDKDFSDQLVITVYGMELCTRSAVSDGEGHWAAVGGNDKFYGEVELIHSQYGEGVQFADPEKPTAAELKALTREMTSQAQRNLAGRYPVPTVVRIPDNSRLDPKAPVTISQLVPGIRVPIRATMTCLVMEQDQKLDKVTVEETEDGENVAITLGPAPGTSPWDDSTDIDEDDEEKV